MPVLEWWAGASGGRRRRGGRPTSRSTSTGVRRGALSVSLVITSSGVPARPAAAGDVDDAVEVPEDRVDVVRDEEDGRLPPRGRCGRGAPRPRSGSGGRGCRAARRGAAGPAGGPAPARSAAAAARRPSTRRSAGARSASRADELDHFVDALRARAAPRRRAGGPSGRRRGRAGRGRRRGSAVDESKRVPLRQVADVAVARARRAAPRTAAVPAEAAADRGGRGGASTCRRRSARARRRTRPARSRGRRRSRSCRAARPRRRRPGSYDSPGAHSSPPGRLVQRRDAGARAARPATAGSCSVAGESVSVTVAIGMCCALARAR